MKLIIDKPNLPAVHFGSLEPGDTFKYMDYYYIRVKMNGRLEGNDTFGVDLESGDVVEFSKGSLVIPVTLKCKEVSIYEGSIK